MDVIQPVAWTSDGTGVRILDQRALPMREIYRELRSVDEVCDAITTLAVRGAPAIGIAGAMGLTLAITGAERSVSEAVDAVGAAARHIAARRPTAVNLSWALDRMVRAARLHDGSPRDLAIRLHAEATRILEEDRAMCRRIGELGAALLADGARVLTHCNAGALATGGMGTALAVVYAAAEQGKRIEVFAGETRPLLQGSRLTAWELSRAGIPVTVIVDSAAAALMRAGAIDLCIVGADRIAANGDVANKIGTYALAISAHYHGVPFYVAAPVSTFDGRTASGSGIVIEERSTDEIRCGFGAPTAPLDVSFRNPAFDVTPAALISAIVSDRAIHRPPFVDLPFDRHS
ncbi:MAG TPA: S-methyl-5-thioribose-1-phosphate isomerase [Gemmatimonadaceae bacterium]|nr:S-methyl-5-thioribose-1-phosphate isomerase [Gemmatimonadaceae bacterium]